MFAEHSEEDVRQFRDVTSLDPSYSHMPPIEAKAVFDDRGLDFEAYFKFTVTRNPFPRMVSNYSLATAAMAWSLWFPALALPAGPINLQHSDLVVLSVLPLVLAYAMQLPGALLIVMSLSLLSAFVSLLAGGQMVIFIYYLVFPTSFAAIVALVIIRSETRIIFLRHFLFAGLFSCGSSWPRSFLVCRTSISGTTPVSACRPTWGVVSRYFPKRRHS